MNNGNVVTAKYSKASISPKKVAPVMDLVRGKNLHEAKLVLAFDRTKAAKFILKTIQSAESNAKNNLKLDVATLYVSELWVSEAPMRKWGRPGSRGRWDPIIKRSSHIFVGLNLLAQAPERIAK